MPVPMAMKGPGSRHSALTGLALSVRLDHFGLRLRPGTAQERMGPYGKYDNQNQGEAVPGHHVLQVLVAESHFEPAGLRIASWRHGRFLLDVERGDVPQPFGCRYGCRVAQEPQIMRRLTAGCEPGGRVRPAQRA